MATDPNTIKGGKVRVLLDLAGTGTYTAQCGFVSRTIKLIKALNEFQLPNCDDPDSVDWLGRDAVSLSMEVDGEGLLDVRSVDTWLDAQESIDSVAVKIEWEFPAKLITWTGNMQVESFEAGAPNAQRVTATVAMKSDGEMVRVTS